MSPPHGKLSSVAVDHVRVVTARAYDQIVDEFVRRNTTINSDLFEFRQDFMRAVGDGARVVDVGCGPGRDALYFASNGLRPVGVDASGNMARHTRREGVPVVVADMRSLPVARDSVNGIWSAASLLHVPSIDVPATLDTWHSLLRPAGVLGLSTSLGEGEGWEGCPYDRDGQYEPDALRRWFVHHDEHQLLRSIELAGFSIHSSRERVSNRRWLQVIASRRA